MVELYNMIINSINGDKESTLNFIKKFNPLIIKYSRKLYYDGAETNFIICLLEILNHISICNSELSTDDRIVGYINTCIKHKYINLSKKKDLINSNETKQDVNIIPEKSFNNIDDYLLVYELLDNLPVFQKQIIRQIYMDNISISDLAKQLHISRQAINRALTNLRGYLL